MKPIRRQLLVALIACGAATVFAQSRKPWRIGFLQSSHREQGDSRLQAFNAGMKELGYLEGRDYVIEARWAGDRYDALPGLAQELVTLKVDLIVTSGTPPTQAAMKATSSIPIVVAVVSGDPVASGLVENLLRPGKNVTGTSIVGANVASKWMEFLKEIDPSTRSVAYLVNSAVTSSTAETINRIGSRLSIQVTTYAVVTPADLPGTFAAIVSKGHTAVVVQSESMLNHQAAAIGALGIRHRLAVVGGETIARRGGLVGYGSRSAEKLFRDSATYVDKILRGAKAGELPMQQEMRFELLVNLKTAKAIGVRVPETLLLRADALIE